MRPNSSLSIRSCVQQSTLYEQKSFANSIHPPTLIFVHGVFSVFFEFVHDDAIGIHCWG